MICFVANYYKTIFLYEVSKEIEKKGLSVVWISPSKRWGDFLLEKGVAPCNVLTLSEYGKEWDSHKPLSSDERLELSSIEDTFADDTFYNLIARDRVLREKRSMFSLRYLLVISRLISSFFDDKDVTHVFGEKTWAHELLITNVAKVKDIVDLCPHSVRVPADRFGFFTGQDQSRLILIEEPGDNDHIVAGELINKLEKKEIKPYYFKINQGVPSFKKHWFGELFRNMLHLQTNAYDETLPSIYKRLSVRLQTYFKASLTAITKPFDTMPSDRSFILVTLHKQPEASIDVLAARCSNQLEAIRALSRSVPASHEIWVKEHSNAIGDRSLSWYNQLKSIPGVRLIDPYADTFALLARADLVVSASGTVCLEAGLLGVPAITFAPMFFSPVLAADKVDPYSLSRSELMSLFGRGQVLKREDRLQFLATVHANTFEGRIGDPIHDPACMDHKNIHDVAVAIYNVSRINI